jgi:hypothetical protein
MAKGWVMTPARKAYYSAKKAYHAIKKGKTVRMSATRSAKVSKIKYNK